jgi:branched-chain amino acid transport system permease protein
MGSAGPTPAAQGLTRLAWLRPVEWPVVSWGAKPWIHGPIAAALALVATQALGPLSYVTFLITISLVYLIAVLGLNIPGGMLGQLSMGQGAVFAIGAYVAGIGTATYGWPLLVTLPAAAAAGLITGIVIGIPASRLDVLGLGMISLGVTLVVIDAVTALQITGGPSGLVIPPARLLPSLPLLESSDLFTVILIAALAAYILHWYLRTSHYGRVFLAIKSQEIGAVALGISPYWYKVGGLAMGTALGAVAGAMYAYVQQVIAPEAFGVDLSILFLLMVILGGAGTRVGPVFGTAILGIVPIALNRYPQVNVYIYGALLILLMKLRPRGLYSRSSAAVNRRALPDQSDTRSSPGKSVQRGGPVVQMEGVRKAFGGNTALKNVTVEIDAGRVTAIVGPNGSGKTTLLNVISGYVAPDSGQVRLSGQTIGGRSPQAIARMGVARTFQVPKVFSNLSVEEHLALASHYRRNGRSGRGTAVAMAFLGEVGLGPKTYKREVRTLGHGHLRFLEIGMGALRSPDLILLDEPAAGLSATEIVHLVNLLRALADQGAAVVVVEHHLDVVRQVADMVAVMHLGQLLWYGEPERLRESAEVRDAYLGAR